MKRRSVIFQSALFFATLSVISGRAFSASNQGHRDLLRPAVDIVPVIDRPGSATRPVIRFVSSQR